MTKYRVLLDEGDGTLVVVVEEIEAHGPLPAMRKAAEDLSAERLATGVDLVAVPVSNWSEESFKTETPPPRLVVSRGEAVSGAVEEEPEPEVEPEAEPDGEGATDGD